MNTEAMKVAKITYGELLTLAKSDSADDRKRGFQLFQAWSKAAPRIAVQDRLTQTERDILSQIFKKKGFDGR